MCDHSHTRGLDLLINVVNEATVSTMAAEWGGEDEVLFAGSFSNSGNSSNVVCT